MMSQFDKDIRIADAEREVREARWDAMEDEAQRLISAARYAKSEADCKARIIRAEIELERWKVGSRVPINE